MRSSFKFCIIAWQIQNSFIAFLKVPFTWRSPGNLASFRDQALTQRNINSLRGIYHRNRKGRWFGWKSMQRRRSSGGCMECIHVAFLALWICPSYYKINTLLVVIWLHLKICSHWNIQGYFAVMATVKECFYCVAIPGQQIGARITLALTLPYPSL